MTSNAVTFPLPTSSQQLKVLCWINNLNNHLQENYELMLIAQNISNQTKTHTVLQETPLYQVHTWKYAKTS